MTSRRTFHAVLALSVASAAGSPARAAGAPPALAFPRPLAFEANHGQTDPRVRFVSRGSGYTLFLTRSEAVLALQPPDGERARIAMTLVGANPEPKVAAEGELPGRSHYFIGSDASRWRHGVKSHAAVRYREVYPGVDLVFHGANAREIEYDFVVAPGADPGRIRLRFEGAARPALAGNGDLVLRVAGGEVVQRAPVAYQDADGVRHPVQARFEVRGKRVGFRVGAYDRTRPLVIDPVLVYSNLFGGSSAESASAAAVDGAGNAYVTGVTGSTDFPTLDPYQGAPVGGGDPFISKFSPEGVLVYSTYLGGPGSEEVRGIAVDASGSVSVVGQLFGPGFPVVNAVQTGPSGNGDAFVSRLSPAGDALVFSTYLGGSRSDAALDVAADAAGRVHVVGGALSANFPLVNPLQAAVRGEGDAFVARFSPTGTLLYSTYLGGNGGDAGTAVAVDAQGSTYVAGVTLSHDFPTVNAFQSSPAGGPFPQDGFVAKLTAAGDALAYSTYLGGSDRDEVAGLGVDAVGSAYVGGRTESTDFPTHNAAQPVHGGNTDSFIAKLSPQGNTLVYSTYLGGTSADYGHDLAADSAGNAYVVGETSSPDLPILDAVQPTKGFIYDAFVTRFSPTGAIVYSTFYDGAAGTGTNMEAALGVAADDGGNVYVAGVSYLPPEPDFTEGQAKVAGPPALLNGSSDAFLFRIASGGANQPPECSAAAASPAVLWSPNHEMVRIAIAGVTDPEGDPVTVTVDAVRQDEPTDGVADGDTCPDAEDVGTEAPTVRAERSGRGDGRVYHLAFTGRDAQGASCTGVATVCVPHDQEGTTCVDQGPLHDSTQCE